jgi:16S rRNA (adenine1518-N6/adenine1519-N6)-dimethyltransferase
MKPKKRLGQHFLTAPSYAKKIAAAIPAGPQEHVLEIGPGRGALSVHLKERFPRFHMVEIDNDVIPGLTEKLGPGQWTMHRCDAMKFDFLEAGVPLHVAGNLPYAIAALLIKKTLLYGPSIASCTFMVQREVAQRITAEAHCKRNGFLSIFCRFFGAPRILFHIPSGAFFPKPKVESSVFQLVAGNGPATRLPPERWDAFFKFVDRGFKMRRKTLVNALGREGSKAAYTALLNDLGINPMARPEDLTVEEWFELYEKACSL